MPLTQDIEPRYCTRFGQERPDVVLSIEARIRRDEEKKAQRHEAKLDLQPGS